MRMNLVVIRTEHPSELKRQYEVLGLTFKYHQHGNGPMHFASDFEGLVFEIYPLTKSMNKPDNSLRIGFEVNDLEQIMNGVRNSDWIIRSEISNTEWGLIAVIQDFDGRKVELKNK
ncbi:MAG: glyoxalase/bleomycin resistance/extradiol dioxygenase family protein [Cyclobacteriaceae bacterium]